jgi:hypothetical protein
MLFRGTDKLVRFLVDDHGVLTSGLENVTKPLDVVMKGRGKNPATDRSTPSTPPQLIPHRDKITHVSFRDIKQPKQVRSEAVKIMVRPFCYV